MSNLNVALASFWQLARHCQQGEAAKLEMSCEAGSLNIQLNANLVHPDSLHIHHPLAPPCKRKSPSQLCRQGRRRHEAKTNAEQAKTIHNLGSEDIDPSKEAEKTKELFGEPENSQYSSNISPMTNAEKPSQLLKCDHCDCVTLLKAQLYII